MIELNNDNSNKNNNNREKEGGGRKKENKHLALVSFCFPRCRPRPTIVIGYVVNTSWCCPSYSTNNNLSQQTILNHKNNIPTL